MRGLPHAVRALPGVLALGVFALFASPWPDDWDAVGFVRAVTDFDLARFQPHPPGYPVYVALSRVLHTLGPSPVMACDLASALGGALAVTAIARATRAGVWSLVLLGSPLLLLAATSAHSDALGAGLTALGLALAVERPVLSSVALALALGARPSALALVLPVLALAAWPRDVRAWRRTLTVLGVFTALCGVWAVALGIAAGGAARYLALTRAQAEGHFGLWGHSAWTQPGAGGRLRGFAWGLFTVGWGVGVTPAGLARAIGWTVLAVRGARAMGARRTGALAAMLLPYTVWVLLGQNPDEPRHLLPVVLAMGTLAVAGVRGVGVAPGVALGVLLALPGVRTAWTRRTVAPAGVQAARWVRTEARGRSVMVFGGRSVRGMEYAGMPVMTRTWMGEVEVSLEQIDRLPARVWVTDEVEHRDQAGGVLGPGRRFCREGALDGRNACVTVFRYVPRGLPAEDR